MSLLSGILAMSLAPLADPNALLGQLGPLIDRSAAALLDTLLRQAGFLSRVQTGASILLLVGSLGLLLRKKWGWYLVVVVHLAAVVAVFIWVAPMCEKLYLALDPTQARVAPLLLSSLGALAPAIVVAFLMTKPIIRQFERGD